MNKYLQIQNHQVIKRKIKGEICGTNLWENTLPTESIKTQKVTNAPHYNSQSEPPAPKQIMVDKL